MIKILNWTGKWIAQKSERDFSYNFWWWWYVKVKKRLKIEREGKMKLILAYCKSLQHIQKYFLLLSYTYNIYIYWLPTFFPFVRMNFEIHFHEKLKKENHDCRTVDIQVRTINVTLLFCNSLPWETHLPYKKKIPFLVKKNLLQILLWFFKGKKIMFLPSSKKGLYFLLSLWVFWKSFLEAIFFALPFLRCFHWFTT